MVTYQNLDLRNVIVHGNSSEQDLVQTHCLGRRLTLQVQSLQTSRQSKSGDVANVANCCKLQVQTITKPTMSVLVAICINASVPTFCFCGIDNDETLQGVLLRFDSRL